MWDPSKRHGIATKVASYISDSKGLPERTDVGLETSLLKSGLVDSLGIGDLIIFLEATFNMKVDVEDMIPDNFETVAAIVAFVERKMEDTGR